MLNRIEQKLTAILGDDLATRTHLSVLEAPGPPSTIPSGEGAVLVSLSETTSENQFEREIFTLSGSESRRVLPVQFAARIEFFIRPGGNSAAQTAAARNLLLEDLSLVSHGLARETMQNGKEFVLSDPDPGFRVSSFSMEGASIDRDQEGQFLTAALRYRGKAQIWPPGIVQQEGEIRAVASVLVALPVAIEVQHAVVRAGETATLKARSLPGTRLAGLAPPSSQILQLAVTVLSDAPPAQRGTISGGGPGAENGFRILPVTPPETTIIYQAPVAGIDRTRLEYVAIHLATPDAHRGVFLGSTAIRLEPSS